MRLAKNASKKHKFAAEAVKAQKERIKILDAKAKMELFTVKIDEYENEACQFLSLMRKKALNRTRSASQEDCKED